MSNTIDGPGTGYTVSFYINTPDAGGIDFAPIMYLLTEEQIITFAKGIAELVPEDWQIVVRKMEDISTTETLDLSVETPAFTIGE